jgi:hypothetical protein
MAESAFKALGLALRQVAYLYYAFAEYLIFFLRLYQAMSASVSHPRKVHFDQNPAAWNRFGKFESNSLQ